MGTSGIARSAKHYTLIHIGATLEHMKYRRLNITLPEDTLARADAFAAAERYSRSALIAEALEAYVGEQAGGVGLVREPSVTYASEAVGLNPGIRPFVPEIISACRRHGVVFAALVGSSTQPDPRVIPRDLDLLVRFGAASRRDAFRYLDLREDLQVVTGMDVDLIMLDAVANPRLSREFERTQVVLLEVA